MVKRSACVYVRESVCVWVGCSLSDGVRKNEEKKKFCEFPELYDNCNAFIDLICTLIQRRANRIQCYIKWLLALINVIIIVVVA